MTSSTIFDDQNMGERVKGSLKECGQDVKIYPMAKIVKPAFVEIGDHSIIDDFTFINGGTGTRIGRYVHISCFTSVIGGGELIIGDYVTVSSSSTIVTATETYYGGKRMSSALPQEQRNAVLGRVIIEKDAFIGTNVVVHPNVRIGEGAIIGSNSLVLKDIEPWSINAGSPCQKIKDRPRLTVEDI